MGREHWKAPRRHDQTRRTVARRGSPAPVKFRRPRGAFGCAGVYNARKLGYNSREYASAMMGSALRGAAKRAGVGASPDGEAHGESSRSGGLNRCNRKMFRPKRRDDERILKLGSIGLAGSARYSGGAWKCAMSGRFTRQFGWYREPSSQAGRRDFSILEGQTCLKRRRPRWTLSAARRRF